MPKIVLNESQLHKIVSESVKRILKEYFNRHPYDLELDTYEIFEKYLGEMAPDDGWCEDYINVKVTAERGRHDKGDHWTPPYDEGWLFTGVERWDEEQLGRLSEQSGKSVEEIKSATVNYIQDNWEEYQEDIYQYEQWY